MDRETLRTDPIGALLDMEGDSAQIVPDPKNGYDRVIPEPGLLEELGALYAAEILQTDKDYEPAWKELLDNENAYEGRSELGETITLPLCKRITNQQVAWVSTQILTKKPIISVKPIDGGSYEIPSAVAQQGPQPVYQTQTLSAENAAKLYEAFLQYKLTEKLDFEQLVEDTVQAIHIGEKPTWWKITYDPRVRHAKRRKLVPMGQNRVQDVGIEDYTVPDGEAVRIDHVSTLNMTMPMDERDEQTSRWLSERTPMTPTQIWAGFKSQRFDLCKEDKVPIEKVRALLGLKMSEGDTIMSVEQMFADIDKRVQSELKQTPIDVRTVWLFLPIKRTVKSTKPADDGGGLPKEVSEDIIEIHSLCGTLHVQARQFLNLYVNPYWHGKRPYIPFFMRKRAHRFSGTSSVGDVAPIQRLVSMIFHAQLQNVVQQNVKVFLIRNNSVTHRHMQKNPNRRPGEVIPYDDKDDVNPVHLGSPVQSLSAEISFLNGEADRLAVERDYTDLPGRTPAASIAQFESLAKMQPQTILRGVRRRISRGVEMYLQTVAQFNQYETIPFLDPQTQTLTRKLISFPRETIENHFSFDVTATGDEDSAQARIEKTTILLDQMDKANESALNLTNIAIDPMQPPPARQLAKRMVVRRELIVGEMVRAMRADYEKFFLSEDEINEAMAQADAIFLQAQQAAAAAAEQEALNGANIPAANAGGALPGVPAGQPGLGIPSPEQGDAGMAIAGPQGDPLAGDSPVGLQ